MIFYLLILCIVGSLLGLVLYWYSYIDTQENLKKRLDELRDRIRQKNEEALILRMEKYVLTILYTLLSLVK